MVWLEGGIKEFESFKISEYYKIYLFGAIGIGLSLQDMVDIIKYDRGRLCLNKKFSRAVYAKIIIRSSCCLPFFKDDLSIK